MEGQIEATSPELPVQDDGASPTRGPPCIIDWSDRLERAAADMRRAIIVLVFGDHPPVTPDDIKAIMAARFSLNLVSLEAKQAGEDTMFFVVVDTEETAARLVDSRPSIGSSGPRLHLRQWMRQAFDSSAFLPNLVDVELRGVPTHAWEMTTAENLLNPYGWPQLLHPSTRNRDDYSVFRLSTWCFRPNSIPGMHDLHVVEPSIGVIDTPPGKPTLVYPITISVKPAIFPQASNNSSPSEGDEDPERRRPRRRPRREDSSNVPPSTPTGEGVP
ncbi:hypothetical protein PR202_ga12501 [Eleusine coracana subsp. coracana]|uniref:Uncharacterized protein n=1 Tax=Eleusine coracana subsp. coracana TaxID=191504 RepID=A0AAV5CCA4_ELECO|nr:hypothetical protein QOZ80_3AG0228280 [Eleusine coracana subsp. coracana]GJM95724.1 hypothetical protein PR202_ga12501 [Eleusine coracana subsp. coracana]